jgi:hypothetical protein
LMSGSRTVLHDWIKATRGLSAAESGCASVRISAHPPTTPQVRASPVQRPTPRAGCVSTDRGNASRRETTPLPPSTHPQPGSRTQPTTARRRISPPSGRQVPAEEPLRVLRCCVERMESLLPLARIRARVQANPREMSRKAVAQEIPFSG